MTLIQYYDIKSPYYLIEEHQMRLQMKSGRTLLFIPTPYLHFAGSFTTYDGTSKCLFSSDLFGAFSYNRTLFADENYMGKMLSFHEHYMPSNSVLRPVMDVLSMYDIEVILPQHGSIINHNISEYVNALRTLECGSFLAPVKKNLMQSGGYTMIFREIYQRISSLYLPEEVKEVFDVITEIEFNEKNEITGYKLDGETVWNTIFNVIKSRKGMIWLVVLQSFVENLCAVYDLPMPDVFSNALDEIVAENMRLLEINQMLGQTIESVNNRLVRCKITGLYNEAFFRSLLLEELANEDWRDLGILVCIGIDDFTNYKIQYGIQDEHTALINMAYLLKEDFGSNAVFRLDIADFALYVKGLNKQDLIERMDHFRVKVAESDYFLGDLTISAGIAFPDEIQLDAPTYDTTAGNYLDLAIERLRMAIISGKNKICFEGEEKYRQGSKGKVLLVYNDITNVSLVKTFLEEDGMEVFITDNGIDAMELALEHLPDVIVSEIMLNKMDGFGLRNEILKNSKTKDIETIFLSYKKDDESVKRAIQLGVTYYIHKPYFLSELLGIVKRIVRGVRT